MIGLAAGLSKLEDGDEEFLFLTYPEQDEWLRPYLGGACRIAAPRRGTVAAAGRGSGRARAPAGVGLGSRSVPATGRPSERGPTSSTFRSRTPSPPTSPASTSRTISSTSTCPICSAPGCARRREGVYRTHCDRAAMVVAMTSWGKRDFIAHYGLSSREGHRRPGRSVLREYPAPDRPDIGELRSRLSLPEASCSTGADLAAQEPQAAARGARLGSGTSTGSASRSCAPASRRTTTVRSRT